MDSSDIPWLRAKVCGETLGGAGGIVEIVGEVDRRGFCFINVNLRVFAVAARERLSHTVFHTICLFLNLKHHGTPIAQHFGIICADFPRGDRAWPAWGLTM